MKAGNENLSSRPTLPVVFPLDESSTVQLHLDFRTGRPTAIGGAVVSDVERAACAALNRRRARGILEAAQLAPSGESISPDVWTTAFTRKVRDWDVPLVSLAKLGLTHDEDGFLTSDFLLPLPPGAEASPWLDREEKVVYKLFNLNPDGSLGKQIAFEINDEGDRRQIIVAATLRETLEKIQVLHEAGGLPTEIVGLSDDGSYLIVKQPQAFPYREFQTDLDAAVAVMRGVPFYSPALERYTVVVWVADRAWLVSDLHERNIMRDARDAPTVIDAVPDDQL